MSAPAKKPKVVGLGCPNCGGALDVAPGQRVLACPYCASSLLALGERGVERFAVLPKVEAKDAGDAARAWWSGGIAKHPGLKAEAVAAEPVLCFLPFYRAEADAVGHAFGVEEKTEGSGKNRRTVRRNVERRLEEHLEQNQPAVRTAELGIRTVDLTGDELLPYDPDLLARLGMVFPPTTSEAEARAEMLEDFKDSARPGAGLKEVTFEYVALLRERFSVIHYPYWIVRYKFRGRAYQAVIDAEDGRLAYGKAPGNDLFRAVTMVAAEGGACFLATSVLQWTFSGSNDSFGLLIAALAASAGLLYWGWRKFRYGGVVEDGYGHTALSVAAAPAALKRQLSLALAGKVPGGGSSP